MPNNQQLIDWVTWQSFLVIIMIELSISCCFGKCHYIYHKPTDDRQFSSILLSGSISH